MEKNDLLKKLKIQKELEADLHDGSYELMREVVAAYAKLDEYIGCTYKDLDAIYSMAIGTWAFDAEDKKDRIMESCLDEYEKERLCQVIDNVWDKACEAKYQFRESGKATIGMFGTGFRTFSRNAQDSEVQRFIELLVDINMMDNDEEMFSRAEVVLNNGIKGVQAAAASEILHCLKPYDFPIINGRNALIELYEDLGLELKNPTKLYTYIENARKIRDLRNSEFAFKNYRIMDIVATKIYENFWPSLDEYDPGISKEQFVELLRNSNIGTQSRLDVIYLIYKEGGQCTCKRLSEKYGRTADFYNTNAINLARSIHEFTKCPVSEREDGGIRYWAILFFGRDADKEDSGKYLWKMREPLRKAVEQLDEEGFFKTDYLEKNTMSFDLNTILYGPPGTGKTYNTVYYAVSICRPDLDVGGMGYQEVLTIFNELMEKGRIAFTTFHQSYGYEEFIEGYKPQAAQDEDSTDVIYDVTPGVFKKFCERAVASGAEAESLGLNKNPVIWKVSLGHTYDNDIRTECMENDHIRIGWDEYGEDITDDMEYEHGGKTVLNAFINKMKIGDIIFSCYTASTIDAIGVVTGEYEYHYEYSDHKRLRKVKWVVKGINENIVDINNGSNMVESTVYRMKVSLNDAVSLISQNTGDGKSVEEASKDNFVFIIDEINRGNISKIFGELITLIEDTKRAGAGEAIELELPYSHQKFSVPSNVYILGTMNTADRSIALMDTALRRRFSFVEMMPNPQVLVEQGIEYITEEDKELDVVRMLEVINKRIEVLYDREHTIGHAFFIPLRKDHSRTKLSEIFKKSIIPLLQEYFYEDYSKIQLVLGDNDKSDDKYKFVIKNNEKMGDIFKGKIDIDLNDDSKFSINEDAFNHIESYIEIYCKRYYKS